MSMLKSMVVFGISPWTQKKVYDKVLVDIKNILSDEWKLISVSEIRKVSKIEKEMFNVKGNYKVAVCLFCKIKDARIMLYCNVCTDIEGIMQDVDDFLATLTDRKKWLARDLENSKKP